MSWFEFLLFTHIAMAVVWVGGGLMMQFFGIRASMSGDPSRLAAFGQDVEWIANRVFIPGSLLAFAERHSAGRRVGLLRVRRRLDRDRSRALRNDLLRRIAVPRTRSRPYRRAHGEGLSGRRSPHLAADHARPSRSRPSLPARLRHGGQAGLRRRELHSLGPRRRGGHRSRPHLLALPSRPSQPPLGRPATRPQASSSTRSSPPATRSPVAT